MLRNATSIREDGRRVVVDRQSKILGFAQSASIELVEALAWSGWDLDDLVYEIGDTKQWTGRQPVSLTDLSRTRNGIPFVSFFSGCGGMDIGFEAAGYEHLAGFEINELFCKTLRHNRPGWDIFGPPTSSGDVSNFYETRDTLSTMIAPGFDGVFIGGPPCQPFSIASNQRFPKSGSRFKRVGFDHERNGGLLFKFVELIEYFRPLSFVIENVVGLRDLDDGLQLNSLMARLGESGYLIEPPRVLNAANYGVPQFRERLFIVGTRSRHCFVFPLGTNERIGSGAVLSREQRPSPNHETRKHKLASIMRYTKLDYGERDQLGRVDRLDPCKPAKTVIAGGNSGGGRSHLHPEIPRTLTVRECARLQSFPDDFVFTGTVGRQFTQVGNAVPPVLAAQVAIALYESVFKGNYIAKKR